MSDSLTGGDRGAGPQTPLRSIIFAVTRVGFSGSDVVTGPLPELSTASDRLIRASRARASPIERARPSQSLAPCGCDTWATNGGCAFRANPCTAFVAHRAEARTDGSGYVSGRRGTTDVRRWLAV